MTLTIDSISAYEILDSRGRPTLEVCVAANGNPPVSAQVPSGASTGSEEAVELRDGDPDRYDGNGVQGALTHVTGVIAGAIAGRRFSALEELDAMVLTLDATANKSALGANAIVGLSMAAARAFALEGGRELWQYLATDGVDPCLPVPHFNVINGGAHAGNALEFQEFMIAPLGAPTLAEAVRAGAEVYAALRRELSARGLSTGLGDEGGFAPDLREPAEALSLLVSAIEAAGYAAGTHGVAIALDPAANGFYRDGHYHVAGQRLTPSALVDLYQQLADEFPIWSIEDGLGETDVEGWRHLTERLGETLQLVGDDILVTDPAKITAASLGGIGNAALIKVNQIGTVTETLAALQACRDGGFTAMISHRSGETPDSFIADLAVGSGCGQLKSGAPARGERTAKYNRLMRIEHDAPRLPYGSGNIAHRRRHH